VVIDFANAEAVHHKLIAQGFNIDYRPKAGIRIAPHFYNTDEEIEAIMAAIKKLAKR